jgi:hypothetical protein
VLGVIGQRPDVGGIDQARGTVAQQLDRRGRIQLDHAADQHAARAELQRSQGRDLEHVGRCALNSKSARQRTSSRVLG